MDGPSPDMVGAFRALRNGPDPDLFEGALLVARLIDPEADLERARARVAELADRVAQRRASGSSPLEALRGVLFGEEGFTGDTESYDAPPNSSVVHVLRAGSGMPITLSIVVREVGRRAGVALEGIGLPGHFVLGGPDLPEGLYLDPFHGGSLCDAPELRRRVEESFGADVVIPVDVFEPDPPVAILRRVLANLRRSYERRHRYEEALGVLDCAEALAPGDASARRERGLLLLKAGRAGEAVEVLEAYVAAAPRPDAAAIEGLLGELKEQTARAGRPKRLFTLEEARSLLPRVREKTSDAVSRCARLGAGSGAAEQERQNILRAWAREMEALGLEIKGPWLVDFDSGAGYYCWKYPEPSLEYFHSYEEGFAGRLRLQ